MLGSVVLRRAGVHRQDRGVDVRGMLAAGGQSPGLLHRHPRERCMVPVIRTCGVVLLDREEGDGPRLVSRAGVEQLPLFERLDPGK